MAVQGGELRAVELSAGWFELLAALRRRGEPFQLIPSELLRPVLRTSGALTSRLNGLERDQLSALLAKLVRSLEPQA